MCRRRVRGKGVDKGKDRRQSRKRGVSRGRSRENIMIKRSNGSRLKGREVGGHEHEMGQEQR